MYLKDIIKKQMLWSLIKQKWLSLKRDPKKIFVSIITIVLFVLLYFESGYELANHISSRITKIIFLALLFLAGVLLILFIDIQKIQDLVKNKKFFVPSFGFLFLATCFVIVVISFLCNNKTENLNTFINFASILFVSYVFTRTFSFHKFAKMFVWSLFVVSLLSFISWAFLMISGFDFATSLLSRDSNFIGSFLGAVFYFERPSGASYRLQGPFWEPGVFATFLSIGLLLYFFFFNNKKKSFYIPLLFCICIFLTFSTAGYIILFVILLVFLSQKMKKKSAWVLFGFSLAAGVLGVLFFKQISNFLSLVAPNVFEKLSSENESLATREYSFIYAFKVFCTSPWIGVGSVTARKMYFDLIAANGGIVNAFTSTPGFLIASYGVVGFLIYLCPIVGIFSIRTLKIPTRFFLALSYILITNQENQSQLMLLMICYFYLGFAITRRIPKLVSTSRFDAYSSQANIPLNFLFQHNTKGVVSLNVFFSSLIKIVSILTGIITIPVYLLYFGSDNVLYGAWLTMISVISWVLTLDLGFGNSLRNKLSEAVAKGDTKTQKAYISSTYFVTLIMTLAWILAAFFSVWFLDLNSLFNLDSSVISGFTLKATMLITLFGVAFQLSLRNITYILDVLGKSAYGNSLSLVSNIIVLVAASVIRVTGESRYIVLASVYAAAVIVPYLIPTLQVFLIQKKFPFPSFRATSKASFKAIFGMGAGFFVVQISSLFLWSINDLLITQMFGGTSLVVEYTEYVKIYNSIAGLFTVIQGPIWVLVSAALVNKNIPKIKKAVKASLAVSTALFIAALLASACLPLLFDIWLGDSAPQINWAIVIVFIFYSFINDYSAAFMLISNGMGDVKPQAIIAIATSIAKIPLSFVINFVFGNVLSWSSLVLTNAILLIPYMVVCPIRIRNACKKMTSESKQRNETELVNK